MTSKEIYDLAMQRVDSACEHEDSNLMNLEEMGFEKKDLNEGIRLSGRVPNELYSILGEDGNKVEVLYYAYDPTKSFSPIEPDINKFTVSLYKGSEVEHTHRNEYSD
jgi:hypothetical protein